MYIYSVINVVQGFVAQVELGLLEPDQPQNVHQEETREEKKKKATR